MLRSKRRVSFATPREPHAHALHAQTKNKSARGTRESRAAAATKRRLNRTIAQRFANAAE
eukprot:301000-Lingulodinium_polyedra.AAC.1